MTPHHIIQRVKDAVDIAALVAEHQEIRKSGEARPRTDKERAYNAARMRQWSKDHPEESRARARAQYRKHPQKKIQAATAWRKKNYAQWCATEKTRRGRDAERLRQWRRENHLHNLEKHHLRSKEWAIKNKAKRAAIVRRYRKSHPDKVRQFSQTRRKLIAKGGARWKTSDIVRIRAAQSNKCANPYCAKELTQYVIDHVIAIARGGTNDPLNLQLMCRSCNSRKWAKPMESFLESERKRLCITK